jgi:hypothetical protein
VHALSTTGARDLAPDGTESFSRECARAEVETPVRLSGAWRM